MKKRNFIVTLIAIVMALALVGCKVNPTPKVEEATEVEETTVSEAEVEPTEEPEEVLGFTTDTNEELEAAIEEVAEEIIPEDITDEEILLTQLPKFQEATIAYFQNSNENEQWALHGSLTVE